MSAIEPTNPMLHTLDELATGARRARDLLTGAAALLERPSYAPDAEAIGELVRESRGCAAGMVTTIEGLIARVAEREREHAQAGKHVGSAGGVQ